MAGCSQRLLGQLAAHAVLGGGVARTLETLREAGPMECVGDTLQELGPLVALVGSELRTQPALQLQAKEALASALMLRYAELAQEMSDSYGSDEAHAEGDGVMRSEMLRRLLENLEDVRRFFAEREGGGPGLECPGLEALQERLQRAVRAKWLGEAQGPGASPFRTRGEAAAAIKGASSTKAALSKGMGQLGSKMSLFGKDMSSKLEARLEEAREAREKAAERDRLRAEERAKAEATAAALPPLPPMG